MNTYYPLTGGFVITSPYGRRGNEFHWGTDFGRPGGSGGNPVHAVRRGTVVMVGPAQGFGHWVVVDSPDGGTHVYGHVVPEVRLRQEVSAGERIAHIDPNQATNGGVAPHLHLEWHQFVWVPPGGERLDPYVQLLTAKALHLEEGIAVRKGLDYAGGVPKSHEIRNRGYDFVVRYLSSGGASLPGKLLTPAEADAHRLNGVDIVSNWETWANRMLDGYDAGRLDAGYALTQVLLCGGNRDRPIYFSADWDVAESETSAIHAYLDGAASILGRENVGIYGGYWAVKRALDAGKATWAWQTGAWSGGNVDPRINIFQHIGFVTVDGVQCDENSARTEDFGQWSTTTGDDMANWLKDTIPTQYTRDPDGTIRLANPGEDTIKLEAWELFSWLDGRVARTEATVNEIHRIIAEHAGRIAALLDPPK